MSPRTPDPAAPAAPKMTPERWRAVDAILQAVLACEPARRAAFIAEACGDDAAMRREVESLLAAMPEDDEFLERPAAAALGVVPALPLAERIAAALAGRYAIERELARGGMATVFLARDLRHNRRVAIKVLRDELAAAVGAERFLKEIEVTAGLQHPHILPLFDSGSAGGLLYYVMPYVEGETLRSRLKRERQLPLAEATRLAREMAEALEHAHRQGVVHRDVKPENVLLQDGHALVADFGIALALEEAGGDRITRTGLTLGTPQYMAPEQAAGERRIDARADVYALGAVLHEMVAGESPFAAPSAQLVMARVLTEPPAALARRRPDVAPHLDAAVRRALEKRPADRFPSAAAFAAALAEPAPAPVAPAPEPRRREGPRLVSVGAAARVAMATLAIGVAAGWFVARLPVFRPGADPVRIGADAVAAATDLAVPRVGEDVVLTVVGRDGEAVRAIDATRAWTPRFSPDGRRIAYGAFGRGRNSSDLWVTDLESGKTERITDGDGDANDAVWSPDGKSLAYSLDAQGGKDVWVRRFDEDVARRLAQRAGNQFPSDWLKDGSGVVVTEDGWGSGRNVSVQPVDGAAARTLLASEASESAARVSPDGRWLAYTVDVPGGSEVWARSLADPSIARRISAGKGMHPAWRGDGREIYYWQDNELFATEVALEKDAILLRRTVPLFKARYHAAINAMYDVSPDGQRFVVVQDR